MGIDSSQAPNILKKAGLKITPARVSILEMFIGSNRPLNADDLYKKLKGRKIDKVTVYRNILAFEEKLIIKKVDLRKDSTFFELSNNHHHHIVCTRCGIIEDFSVSSGGKICWAGRISRDILKKSKAFKVIEDHSLEFFGICKNCKQ